MSALYRHEHYVVLVQLYRPYLILSQWIWEVPSCGILKQSNTGANKLNKIMALLGPSAVLGCR